MSVLTLLELRLVRVVIRKKIPPDRSTAFSAAHYAPVRDGLSHPSVRSIVWVSNWDGSGIGAQDKGTIAREQVESRPPERVVSRQRLDTRSGEFSL